MPNKHSLTIRWLIVLLAITGTVNVNAREKARQHKPATPSTQAELSPKTEMAAHSEDLRALMLTLYNAHPDMLAKSTQVGPREMTDWVFENKTGWQFEGLRRLQGKQALDLLFDPIFHGDQVLALIVGLETLIYQGYGAENEYAIPVQSDAQRQCQLVQQLAKLHQHIVSINEAETPVILNAFESKSHITRTIASILERIQHQTAKRCVIVD